jgi:hypothetical protein
MSSLEGGLIAIHRILFLPTLLDRLLLFDFERLVGFAKIRTLQAHQIEIKLQAKLINFFSFNRSKCLEEYLSEGLRGA